MKSKAADPKPGTEAWYRRPFDPDLWAEAKALAERYRFRVEHDPEEPYFYAFGIEAKGAMGGGKTIQTCLKDIRKSMTLWIATMLEDGRQPPAPASDEKRTAQVNVRLTVDEKFRIEEASRRAGFRGVSDFVRAAALDKAG